MVYFQIQRARLIILAALAGWLCTATVYAAPAMAQTASADNVLGPEIRGGILAHDVGIFDTSKEEGVDLNAEYLFRGFGGSFFTAIGSPRPHIGFTVNTEGDTSQAYTGLSWQFTVSGPVFMGGSLGFSLNDGETSTDDRDRKSLGSHVLFRESIEVGIRIVQHHSLSLMLDHISNANLFDHNEGLNTIGLRYGYRF